MYDTTLTLAVLVRDTLYYGHSGDSGMIALTTSGRYEKVTEQQRDEQGRVFPLFFNDKWEFAEYEHKVSAVLLATDGMLETFFPMYIKNHPVSIHISLAQFFLDYHSLRIVKLGPEAVQTRIREFMENIPDEKVNDDKTVAVLINTFVRTKKQPTVYYEGPDWAALKKKHDDEWKRAAYPGLFPDIQNLTKSAIDQTSPDPSNTNNEEVLKDKQNAFAKRTPRKSRKMYFMVTGLMILCFSVAAGMIILFFGCNSDYVYTLPSYEDTYVPEPNYEDKAIHDTDENEADEYEAD